MSGTMTKQWIAIVLAGVTGLGTLGLAGCERPTDADCRKAIANIRALTGTDKSLAESDLEAAVRSCRGNGKKKSVECAIKATTIEQLQVCGLVESKPVPEPAEPTPTPPATPETK